MIILQKNRTGKLLLRHMAFFTLVLFSWSTVSLANPGILLSPAPVASLENPRIRFVIPPSLGILQETNFPADFSPASPFIVHIQDVHALPEAQLKIEKLIRFLQRKHGFSLLLLEGAQTRLDPQLFHFFNDPQKNLKMADFLLENGEFSGPERFLLRGLTGRRMRAEGIEDETLYRDNLVGFRKVYASQEEAEWFLAKMEARIEKLSTLIWNPSTRKFARSWKHFHRGKMGLLIFLKILRRSAKKNLGVDFEDPRSQLEYPHLARIFSLDAMSPELDAGKFGAEKRRLLNYFRKAKLPGALIRNFDRRVRTSPAVKQGPRELRGLFEKIYRETPKNFSFKKYPQIALWGGTLILREELRSRELMAEAEDVADKIFNYGARSEDQKELVRLWKDLSVLEKLFALELIRKEYRELLAHKETAAPVGVLRRIKQLEEGARRFHFPEKYLREAEVEKVFHQALEFYQGAERREIKMVDNALRILKSAGESKAILITGGFHSEGLKEMLKTHKVGYAEISPALQSGPNHRKNYLRSVLEREADESHVKNPAYVIPRQAQMNLAVNLAWRDAWIDRAYQAAAASLGTAEANGKNQSAYHFRVDSILQSYDKIYLLYDPAASQYKSRPYEVKPKLPDERTAGEIHTARLEKLRHALEYLRAWANELGDSAMSARAEKIGKATTVIGVDLPTRLLFYRPEDRTAGVYHIGRRRSTIYFPLLFLDSLTGDEQGFEELALYLDRAQRWIDAYQENTHRIEQEGLPAETIYELMEQARANSDQEDQRVLKTLALDLILKRLDALAAEDEETKKTVVTSEINVLTAQTHETEELLMQRQASGENLPTLDDYFELSKLYGRLAHLQGNAGNYQEALFSYRAQVDALRDLQRVDKGLLPLEMQEGIARILLRIRLYDEFLKELEILLSGEGFPRALTREEQAVLPYLIQSSGKAFEAELQYILRSHSEEGEKADWARIHETSGKITELFSQARQRWGIEKPEGASLGSERGVILADQALNVLPEADRKRIDAVMRFEKLFQQLGRTDATGLANLRGHQDWVAFDNIPGEKVWGLFESLLNKQADFSSFNAGWEEEALQFLGREHELFRDVKLTPQLAFRAGYESFLRGAPMTDKSPYEQTARLVDFIINGGGDQAVRFHNASAALQEWGLIDLGSWTTGALDRLALHAEKQDGSREAETAREFLSFFVAHLFESAAMTHAFMFNRSLVEGFLEPDDAKTKNTGVVYLLSGSTHLYHQALEIAKASGSDASRLHALYVNRKILEGDAELLKEYLTTHGIPDYDQLVIADTGFHGTVIKNITDTLTAIAPKERKIHGRLLAMSEPAYSHGQAEVMGFDQVLDSIGFLPDDKNRAALTLITHLLDTMLPAQDRSPVRLERDLTGTIQPVLTPSEVSVFAKIIRDEMRKGTEDLIRHNFPYPQFGHPVWLAWLSDGASLGAGVTIALGHESEAHPEVEAIRSITFQGQPLTLKLQYDPEEEDQQGRIRATIASGNQIASRFDFFSPILSEHQPLSLLADFAADLIEHDTAFADFLSRRSQETRRDNQSAEIIESRAFSRFGAESLRAFAKNGVVYHRTWLGAMWEAVHNPESKSSLHGWTWFGSTLPHLATARGLTVSRAVKSTPSIALAFDVERLIEAGIPFSPDHGILARKKVPFWTLTDDSKRELTQGLHDLTQSRPEYALNDDTLTKGLSRPEEGASLEKPVQAATRGLSQQPLASSLGQEIIPMDAKDIPPQEGLGEKPYKLLRMVQSGKFNIPKFFIVQSNGTGRLEMNEPLRQAFDQLQKPVIVRSAHPDEGREHSFSGVFYSFPSVTGFADEPIDWTGVSDEDKERRLMELEYEEPVTLDDAYRRMVASAADGYLTQKYLEAHQISDFDAKRMNTIVMEQLDMDVFGMFVTSNQNHPEKVDIHYEVRKKPEGRSSFGNEGVVTYNKQTRELEGGSWIDAKVREDLKRFGETAVEIEALFGIQQVELASANGKVYVLQSRTINLGNPKDVPRFAHYETLSKGLEAIGYGYYHLPIIVIDSLENIHRFNRGSDEFLVLEQAWRDTQDKDAETKQKAWQALKDFQTREQENYKQELLRLTQQYPEYILVIKDAASVFGISEKDAMQMRLSGKESGKDYTFLNQLVTQAKAVIRGRNQNAIRHEAWENVEKGGIAIIPSESGGFMDFFGYRRDQDKSWVSLVSGDTLHVLSNMDGAFVWKDVQGASLGHEFEPEEHRWVRKQFFEPHPGISLLDIERAGWLLRRSREAVRHVDGIAATPERLTFEILRQMLDGLTRVPYQDNDLMTRLVWGLNLEYPNHGGMHPLEIEPASFLPLTHMIHHGRLMEAKHSIIPVTGRVTDRALKQEILGIPYNEAFRIMKSHHGASLGLPVQAADGGLSQQPLAGSLGEPEHIYQDRDDFASRYLLGPLPDGKGSYRPFREVMEKESLAALYALDQIRALRDWMDKKGAKDRPLLIWQKLRLGGWYPVFTERLREQMGIQEFSEAEWRQATGSEGHRYILIKHKMSSDVPKAPWVLNEIREIASKLRAPVVMVDHSHGFFSGAQVGVEWQEKEAGRPVLAINTQQAPDFESAKDLLAGDSFFVLLNANPHPLQSGSTSSFDDIERVFDHPVTVGGRQMHVKHVLRTTYADFVEKAVTGHSLGEGQKWLPVTLMFRVNYLADQGQALLQDVKAIPFYGSREMQRNLDAAKGNNNFDSVYFNLLKAWLFISHSLGNKVFENIQDFGTDEFLRRLENLSREIQMLLIDILVYRDSNMRPLGEIKGHLNPIDSVDKFLAILANRRLMRSGLIQSSPDIQTLDRLAGHLSLFPTNLSYASALPGILSREFEQIRQGFEGAFGILIPHFKVYDPRGLPPARTEQQTRILNHALLMDQNFYLFARDLAAMHDYQLSAYIADTSLQAALDQAGTHPQLARAVSALRNHKKYLETHNVYRELERTRVEDFSALNAMARDLAQIRRDIVAAELNEAFEGVLIGPDGSVTRALAAVIDMRERVRPREEKFQASSLGQADRQDRSDPIQRKLERTLKMDSELKMKAEALVRFAQGINKRRSDLITDALHGLERDIKDLGSPRLVSIQKLISNVHVVLQTWKYWPKGFKSGLNRMVDKSARLVEQKRDLDRRIEELMEISELTSAEPPPVTERAWAENLVRIYGAWQALVIGKKVEEFSEWNPDLYLELQKLPMILRRWSRDPKTVEAVVIEQYADLLSKIPARPVSNPEVELAEATKSMMTSGAAMLRGLLDLLYPRPAIAPPPAAQKAVLPKDVQLTFPFDDPEQGQSLGQADRPGSVEKRIVEDVTRHIARIYPKDERQRELERLGIIARAASLGSLQALPFFAQPLFAPGREFGVTVASVSSLERVELLETLMASKSHKILIAYVRGPVDFLQLKAKNEEYESRFQGRIRLVSSRDLEGQDYEAFIRNLVQGSGKFADSLRHDANQWYQRSGHAGDLTKNQSEFLKFLTVVAPEDDLERLALPFVTPFYSKNFELDTETREFAEMFYAVLGSGVGEAALLKKEVGDDLELRLSRDGLKVKGLALNENSLARYAELLTAVQSARAILQQAA